MLKIAASRFVYAMEYFGRIGRLASEPDDPNAACSSHVIESLRTSVSDVEDFIAGFRAPATIAAMRELEDALCVDGCLEKDIGPLSTQVFDRFAAEMGDQWLIIVNYQHSEYLSDDVAPFGDEVRNMFPELIEDIDEAGKCLALSRFTACVFHLMRVMERTVHILSRQMKVSVDLRVATWNDITVAMANSLSSMPGKTAINKRKKQIYGEILANLAAVRIAWRNDVMHPKKTYTQKEAEKIFNHVEGFLVSLLPIV